jgi:hypothetical protein
MKIYEGPDIDKFLEENQYKTFNNKPSTYEIPNSLPHVS